MTTAAQAPPATGPPTRPRAEPRRTLLERRGIPTLVATLGGLALYLAFPAHDLWPLAVLGPAALSVAVHRRRMRAGAWLGFVTGAAYLVPLLSWTGVYVGAWPWLLLATWQATYLIPLGMALTLVQRLPGWPVWAAALWVADEALRGRWFLGGFPWGRLGSSQADGWFTHWVAYGGVPLLGFVVALTGTLLAAAALGRRRGAPRPAPAAAGPAGERRPGMVRAAGLVAVAAAMAASGLLLPLSAADPEAPTVTVAVVQGDVPQPGLDFNATRRAVLDNHVQRTLELADQVAAGTAAQPDFVLWPENSSDIDPYRNPDAADQIDRAARAIGVPILVGAVRVYDDDTLGNLGIVWDPVGGPGQTYLKRHPVPFGEYIPWRSTLERYVPLVNEVPRDFVGGDRPGTLDLGGATVGDLICFEVAYDHLARDVVDAGAQLLVIQTNNATFGYTDETYQQLAMGRLRAVEHGRTVLVGSTSGVSAVVAPDGRVEQESGLFEPAVFVAEVPLRDDRTVATRLGAAPEWVIVGVGLGAVVAAAVLAAAGRRRSR